MTLAPAIFDAAERFGSLKGGLKAVCKTVRAIEDNVLTTNTLPAWQISVGTVTGPTSYGGGNGVAPLKVTTVAATAGSRALVQVQGGTVDVGNIQPSNFTAIAWTVEGLAQDADEGYDFIHGFVDTANTGGGVWFARAYNQIGGGVTCATTASSTTPVGTPVARIVTDGVSTAGSSIVTSATASFVSGDVGKPIGNDARYQSPPCALIPGSVITSVDSSTQVHISIPAFASATNLPLSIGQTAYFRVTASNGGGRWRKNITALWLPQEAMFYLLRDDQVAAEVNVAGLTDATKVTRPRTQMTTQDGSSHYWTWTRSELILAHN